MGRLPQEPASSVAAGSRQMPGCVGEKGKGQRDLGEVGRGEKSDIPNPEGEPQLLTEQP